MIDCKKFYEFLLKNDIDFFTGVPDSLLKDFCSYVDDNTSKEKNIIAANEGNAVAIASGYNLASGKFSLVYMQNSGLGNAINPLTSLCDPKVYSIPMLLVIGLRGEIGISDEPQHAKMGEVTLTLLDALGITYDILENNFESQIEKARKFMQKNSAPYALIVRKDTFAKYHPRKIPENEPESKFELSREQAIESILVKLGNNDIALSTTGKTSRELFELRKKLGHGHIIDFLTVGSMGHCSSIALGICLQKPKSNVFCFDGDGALIMHMGALPVIGQLKPANFRHIVFNNLSHESVGGQPTAASNIDIPAVALSCGYLSAISVKTKKDLEVTIDKIKKVNGPALIEVKIKPGSRKDLGRPTKTPIQNKKDFVNFINELK